MRSRYNRKAELIIGRILQQAVRLTYHQPNTATVLTFFIISSDPFRTRRDALATSVRSVASLSDQYSIENTWVVCTILQTCSLGGAHMEINLSLQQRNQIRETE